MSVTIDPFRGGPLQLVERAVAVQREEARDARRRRGRPHDQIWCMFDRDEHPGFAEAIDLAAACGVCLAVSDPCLELWFLLNFKDQTAFLHRHDAQREALALLKCEKALSPTAAETVAGRYEQAKERAVKLEAKHQGDGSSPWTNPSSGVWRLIDEIRSP